MDKLEFKISSALKNIIGKDLITDDFIAVFELVKNSYDAHATQVDVIFEKEKLTIKDNGKGMSKEDIENKWLFLAYSAKNNGYEDEDLLKDDFNFRNKIQSKRFYAGAKGIGRFSCDRLGEILTLTTRKIRTDTIEQITIYWNEFDKDPKEEFYNIKVSHQTLPKSSMPELVHGTILEITGLFSEWKRKDLQNLKHSLEKLINPFSPKNIQNDDFFKIRLLCEREKENDTEEKINRNKVNGIVQNFIFEILNIKTTQIITTIEENVIITELVDRGEPIYKIREPNAEYPLIKDAKYHLFFLNRAAKANFTRVMGLRPVRFGSIFLFKNGFRVYPFGNVGDDTLGIDQRHQQRYASRLGTRDLLGRIEIFTEDQSEFRETSSRDGGLIDTAGYRQLINSITEKCLLRLEKYVVSVQWNLKEYPELKEDKDKDDVSLLDNIIIKARIINLVKKISDSRDVEILSYNKNFLNIINEKLTNAPPEVFSNLSKIAKTTNDKSFELQINQTEKNYRELVNAKRIAEQKAQKAEEMERKAREAAEKAELKRREEEKKRQEEEYKRLKAEEAKRKANEEATKAQSARKKAEQETQHRRNQVLFLQSVKAIEYEDVRDLNHTIGISSDLIAKQLLIFKRRIDRGKNISKNDLMRFINTVSLANSKILAITKFTTKGNFLKLCDDMHEDIVLFIVNYINNISSNTYLKTKIHFVNPDLKFEYHFRPIEMTIIIDNLINNSNKHGKQKIEFEFHLLKNGLEIICRDFGPGLNKSIPNPELIFEEGFTTSNGSGLGLAHVKKIINDMNGEIFINTDYKNGLELKIRFEK